MGNTTGKLDRCFAGEVSRRSDEVPVSISDLLDEGLGHSFCYIRPQPSRFSSSKVCSLESPAPPFKTISGAAISANTSTPLSTTSIDPIPCVDKASSFESSDCFSSIPLQPFPRSLVSSDPSGPMWHASGGSGDVERGFVSDPMERSFIWSPVENRSGQLTKYKPKFKNWSLIKTLKKAILKSNILSVGGTGEKEGTSSSDKSTENITETSGGTGNNLSSHSSDSEEDEFFESQNVEWAQGKAGEDRVHVVVSEENGWVFAGIYDGFNGPDATDFLQNNLYSNVYKELKGLLWNEKPGSSVNHSDVLKALSMALRKTEEAFLDITDLMMMENPELALMGSCVLVMLMKGDNVYLMNVGDSRAVLAQKVELERIVEESSSTDLETFEADECKKVSTLSTSQLTIEHSTSMKEEVKRIKLEHLDDSSAISKNRVKGSLKVTRAFGAGYLKQPKWNNALLEMFRINYVGNSPYISCSPSLYHHKLGLRDRFLILSSDGLYQYFTNEEAVAEVEMFISLSPGGDPAQHLVEEVLFRAAKQAGLKFHELLDIPQGDRRKYHDDVSIIIISFEGSIWRSSSSL